MKALLRSIMFCLLVTSSVFPQKLEIEVDTQEGQLLQQVDSETDGAKKLVLLEKFAKEFPNHEAAPWVWGQMQTSYYESKSYDKVFSLGTKILSQDPDAVAAAHNCLKAAEATKNVDLIQRWSEQTAQVARKVKQSRKPEDEDDVAEWKQKVDFAIEVEKYAEYALYFAALQARDSKIKGKLMEALEARNPTSEYLTQLRTSQTQVVRQVDIEVAVSAAEASFRKGEYNADQLLMVATHYMQRRRESEKVILYSNKIVEILTTRPRPSDISEGDWDRKKRQMMTTSYWMMGLLYSTEQRYAQADRALRLALPGLGNSDMRAGALFHLGYVNYRLAEAGDRIRIHDAVRYMTECSGINSAVQQQALDNLKSMKAEYNL